MTNTRTKVVCLLDSLVEIGGAETLAVEMIIRLPPERFDRSLVLTRWSDEVAAVEPARSALARLRGAGVQVLGLRRRTRFAVRPWLQLIRFLRRERPDVLHAHKFGSNLWGTVFGRLCRVPVVVAHEHMWSYEDAGRRAVIDRDVIARFADALIAVSAEGRRQMTDLLGIAPDDVTLIPNGVPELPRGDRAATRRALGLDPGTVAVGTIANLRPEKALELLVESGADLAERGLDLQVLIAGEGGERAALERLIRERDATDTVRLLGYREDVADLLSAFDIAVCCSDFEGGPLSVMEYMDAALPIVATEVGGLPELLGGAGLMVPPRDAPALAEAIAALVAAPERRSELGALAKGRRADLYGLDRWVALIEELYAELLAHAARGRPASRRQMPT